jgi:hypothetical protein
MPDREWLHDSANRGCLALVLVLSLVAGGAFYASGERADQYQKEKGAEQQHPGHISAQSDEGTPAFEDAVAESEPVVSDGSNDRQPEEQGSPYEKVFGDSIAQWIMAISGLFAVGISALAAYWLKGTLDANRNSADASRRAAQAALEANEILRAEQRAWLTITLTTVAETGTARDKIQAHVTYRIDNLGKMPSLAAREYIGIFPVIDGVNFAEDLKRFASKCRENFETVEKKMERRIFADHPFESANHSPRPVDADVARSDPLGFFVFCCVVYRHSPDNSIGCTAEAYFAVRSHSILSWLRDPLGDYPTTNVNTEFASTTFNYVT